MRKLITLVAILITIGFAYGTIQELKDGDHIGVKSTDKIGFFATTPVVRQANTVGAWAALQTYGLIATGGSEPTSSLHAGTGTGTYKPSGRLYSTGTAVNTGANTTETDGATYTVPANSLSANGQTLRFRVYGTTAANANTKTVQLYWGGTSVYTTGAVAANAKPWFLNLTIIRTAAGAQTVVVEGQFNAAAVAAVTTATKDETGALIVKNTMTNGSATASDCTMSAANLEYLP